MTALTKDQVSDVRRDLRGVLVSANVYCTCNTASVVTATAAAVCSGCGRSVTLAQVGAVIA